MAKKGKIQGDAAGSLFNDGLNAGSEEEMRMQREGEGGPTRTVAARAEDEEGRGSQRGKEKSPTIERKEAKKGSEKTTGARGDVTLTGKTVKSAQVYVRLPEAMVDAVNKAVSDSPIEFGSASEFIRRSVENELRRRGLMAQYK